MELREMIRKLRADAQMTRAELAKASGLSPHTIRAYEKGQRSPSNESLLSILKAVKVPDEKIREIAVLFMLNDKISKSDPFTLE